MAHTSALKFVYPGMHTLIRVCTILGTGILLWSTLVASIVAFQNPQEWVDVCTLILRTIFQATLSCGISLALGIPLGLFLYNYKHYREIISSLLLIITLSPASVVASSWMKAAKALDPHGWVLPVTGASALILIHVILNTPFIALTTLYARYCVPQEFSLQLNLWCADRYTRARLLWPFLSPSLKGAAILVFLWCCRSFTPALVLRGKEWLGYSLEVLIYQGLMYGHDPTLATIAAGMSTALGFLVILLIQGYRGHRPWTTPLMLPSSPVSEAKNSTECTSTYLKLAGLFFVGIVVSLIYGLGWERASTLLYVTLTSCSLAAVVASASVFIAFLILWGSSLRPKAQERNFATFWLMLFGLWSPCLLGWGIVDPLVWYLPQLPGPLLLIGMQVILTLPLAGQQLIPCLSSLKSPGRLFLVHQLHLSSYTLHRHIVWPHVKREVFRIWKLIFAFSITDSGSVLWINRPSLITLMALWYDETSWAGNPAVAAACLAITLALVVGMGVWMCKDGKFSLKS